MQLDSSNNIKLINKSKQNINNLITKFAVYITCINKLNIIINIELIFTIIKLCNRRMNDERLCVNFNFDFSCWLHSIVLFCLVIICLISYSSSKYINNIYIYFLYQQPSHPTKKFLFLICIHIFKHYILFYNKLGTILSDYIFCEPLS